MSPGTFYASGNADNGKNFLARGGGGLLFAAAIFATIPISAQVTPRGLELSVDGAKAITYGHALRVQRRVARREFRQERRAVRRGY